MHTLEEPPCFHLQGSLTARGEAPLVGHENQRSLGIRVQFEQQSTDTLACCRIEVAGWLIGEQDCGCSDKCPGERNSLLLASG